MTLLIILFQFAFANNLDPHIEKYSELYRIDKKLISSIIRVESSYRPHVYNQGCIGLMQIKYDTAKLMGYTGTVKDLYLPENNIKYGTKYLRYLTIIFEGDTNKIIAGYNRGPGSIEKFPNKDWSKDKYVMKVLQE